MAIEPGLGIRKLLAHFVDVGVDALIGHDQFLLQSPALRLQRAQFICRSQVLTFQRLNHRLSSGYLCGDLLYIFGLILALQFDVGDLLTHYFLMQLATLAVLHTQFPLEKCPR